MPRPMNPARRAALDTGRRFYAGPPCRSGHKGERYTSTNACRECVRLQDRPDKRRATTTATDDPLAELIG